MTAASHIVSASELLASSDQGQPEFRAVRAAEAQAHALTALAIVAQDLFELAWSRWGAR